MSSRSRSSQLFPLPEKILLVLLFIWLALLFSHYFSFHNSLATPTLFRAFFDLRQTNGSKLWANSLGSLKILCCVLLVFYTLWSLGRRLFRWLGLSLENPMLRFCLEAALGILFFNGLWLGLGLNLLWVGPLLLSLWLLFLGAALWDLLRNIKKFPVFPRVQWPGPLYGTLGILGALDLIFSLVQGLSPETYYDSLVYHLATLRFWEFHHGITDFHTNLYSYYPFGAELYFFNGLLLQGSEAAKVLNVLVSGLLAFAVVGWAQKEGATNERWIAWAMVLAFPLVSAAVWTTQTDVFLAFFLVLFFFALTQFIQEKGDRRWALVAGLMGGGALTVKYTAVFGIVAVLVALAFTQREMFRVKYWPRWGILKAALVLSAAPWFLKNYLYTGDPVYPYLSSWFGGMVLPAGQITQLMWDHDRAFLGDASVFQWLTKVLTRDLDKTIAPLLLGFLPFFLWPGKRRPGTLFLTFLVGAWLLEGFLVSHQSRLLIPAFVTAFLTMVLILTDLKNEKASRAWAWAVLLFGLFGFLALSRVSVVFYHGDRVLLGKEDRKEYLLNNIQTASHFSLAQAVGDLFPPSDRLLIAGDARGFYYPRDFITNSAFDEQVLALLARQEKDGAGIGRRLREMGVDDLVVLGEEGMRLSKQYDHYHLTETEWGKLEEFIQTCAEPVYLKDKDAIYRLLPEPIVRKGRVPDLLFWFRNLPAPT